MSDIIKIIIDWTRHAESCANVDSNNILDVNMYPSRPIGYDQKKILFFPHQVGSGSNNANNANLLEPNLSFIGIQHAILLGKNYLNGEFYDIILSSPMSRTIQTALFALRTHPLEKNSVYVVPFINEEPHLNGIDNQNKPLESNIIKQKSAIIKDWIQNNWIEKFDDIEIMTDLIKIKSKLDINSDVIAINKINQILTCKPNAGPIDNLDDAKYIMCNQSVKKTILDICDLLSTNPDPTIQTIITGFRFLTNPKNLLGPKINFTILDNFEHLDKPVNIYDPKKFYSDIIPTIVKKIGKNAEIKILCFTHGNFIKHIIREYHHVLIDHPRNTQVYRETILYNPSNNTINHIDFKYQYIPPLIRQQFQNFETLNMNPCDLRSLRGVLNDKSNITNHMPDVEFYFANINKYKNISGGNYYQKYIKYKTKYLELKKLKNKTPK